MPKIRNLINCTDELKSPEIRCRPQTCRRTAIDLFSGCGGLSLGLKQAGFRVVGAIDIDALAVETYKLNHRCVKVIQKDISKITARVLMDKLKLRPGDLDLLAGCPPCQGYSSIRTRNGRHTVHDSRNDLVFEFVRFVLALRPRTVMMENVPRLADNSRMEIIRKRLSNAGYTVQVRIIDAADHGVPQRRRRMILLASLNGRVSFARPCPRKRTVRETIGRLAEPGLSNDLLHDFPENRSESVIERIRRIPFDGGSRSCIPEADQLGCHQRRPDGFRDVYGRMKWDDVAPTITGGCTNPSKGRFIHPQEHRAITMREAALLQSFPPQYQFSLRRGKEAASIMIGNALPPELIRRHSRQIVKHLNARRILPE